MNAATALRLSVEFEVPESEADLVDRLIAYAKKIGVKAYSRNSHDPNEPVRRDR